MGPWCCRMGFCVQRAAILNERERYHIHYSGLGNLQIPEEREFPTRETFQGGGEKFHLTWFDKIVTEQSQTIVNLLSSTEYSTYHVPSLLEYCNKRLGGRWVELQGLDELSFLPQGISATWLTLSWPSCHCTDLFICSQDWRLQAKVFCMSPQRSAFLIIDGDVTQGKQFYYNISSYLLLISKWLMC